MRRCRATKLSPDGHAQAVDNRGQHDPLADESGAYVGRTHCVGTGEDYASGEVCRLPPEMRVP